jgi:hypothetical protein
VAQYEWLHKVSWIIHRSISMASPTVQPHVVAFSLPRFARDELEAAGQIYQGEFFFEVAVVIAVSSNKQRSIEGQGAPSRNNSGPAS